MRTLEELLSRWRLPEALHWVPNSLLSSRALGVPTSPAFGASGPTSGLQRASKLAAAEPSPADRRTPPMVRGRAGEEAGRCSAANGCRWWSRSGLPLADSGGGHRALSRLAYAGGAARAPGLGARSPCARRRDPGSEPEPEHLCVHADCPKHPSAGGRGHGPAAPEGCREVRQELPLPPANGLRGR